MQGMRLCDRLARHVFLSRGPAAVFVTLGACAAFGSVSDDPADRGDEGDGGPHADGAGRPGDESSGSSGAGGPDGTPSGCAATFCDDFARDPSKVQGSWGTLFVSPNDKASIDEATLHLGISPAVNAGAHAYLQKTFACAQHTLIFDFDVRPS